MTSTAPENGTGGSPRRGDDPLLPRVAAFVLGAVAGGGLGGMIALLALGRDVPPVLPVLVLAAMGLLGRVLPPQPPEMRKKPPAPGGGTP